jgi:carboxypeptidase T
LILLALYKTAPFATRFATARAIDAYHSAQMLEQDLHQLVERHAEIAELHEIGRSIEDRPIWALCLGERRGSTRKLLFMGCHHAREWIAVEVLYLLAQYLLEESG